MFIVSVHLFVRPSVYLFVCLSVCLSVYLFVCQSVCLSVCPSIFPSLTLSIRLIFVFSFSFKGVWHISSQTLIASSPSANGVPPQIRTLRWCENLTDTTFISSESNGTHSHLICTAGER